MNQRNREEDTNNQTDQELEQQLEQLTGTLQNLTLQQQQLRRQSDRVQANIRQIQLERRRRALPEVRTDSHGDPIDIGDYVNFLTRGRFNSNRGTITQISHRRFVSARDSSGRIINREPSNVEIVRKHNESHDRRRRR